jgi:glutaredoxin 3
MSGFSLLLLRNRLDAASGGCIMEKKVVIYGISSCPFTVKAKSAYGDGAIYVDVKEDSSKLQEMLKFSGGTRKVPVIVVGDQVIIGFGGS